MAKSNRRTKRGEAHVRLYRHELDCLAYRTMTPDARAALIEFRALYNGMDNRVFMSVREIQRRVGIGQRRAQRARDELLERGWIKLLEPGNFGRKAKHASVYMLTNEPAGLHGPAPKDFMRWEPDQKSSVANSATDGSQISYRGLCRDPENGPLGSQSGYREGPDGTPLGSRDSYTDTVTTPVSESADPLLWALSRPELGTWSLSMVCVAVVALSSAPALKAAA